jgi:hypothetical protein
MSDVENYLEMLCETHRQCYARGSQGRSDWEYLCMEEFVLKEGQMFNNILTELPDDVPKGPPKMCFQNCMLAISWPSSLSEASNYFYCEGYALGSVLPMLHAWLVTPEGKVVDPTWPEPGSEYFGVAFKGGWAKRQTLKQECYGLLDAWTSEWPLLRGIDPEEWKANLNLIEENV